jgi:hypothetical protein
VHEDEGVTAPELHSPPVYGCVAGAVQHAHAGGTLEPAVLLHTFLPPGLEDPLHDGPVRVDVSGDGPSAATVTVRVLADGRSLSWQLPVAPFVAALPGQPGDDGRMVLLAVVDAEPAPGYWAEAVDCERLAAELQLPVADLVEALRGRLTPWLADDLAVLLHDDAHDRALDRSAAQTLASAVLGHYRGDLSAEKATTDLVRALELAPDGFTAELGGRLCEALVAATDGATQAELDGLLAETGPFETEVLRLLRELPPALRGLAPGLRPEAATRLVLAGADRDETIRAAVSVIARLARTRYGHDLDDADLLRRLSMVDDAGLGRLAGLWVRLAVAAGGRPDGDPAVVAALSSALAEEGRPGLAWLRETAADVGRAAYELAGRHRGRLTGPLDDVRALLEDEQPDLPRGVRGVLALARHLWGAGVGPGTWLQVPTGLAASAVLEAYLAGLDRAQAVDLLDALVSEDLTGVDLLDGFVCATSQLLAHLDQQDDPALRRAQVAELLAAVPGGPRGGRWLLVACVREAPDHDPAAADLRPFLPSDTGNLPERSADRAGRAGMLSAGLLTLEGLAAVFGEPAQLPREELLTYVLPSALAEHGLLRGTE